MLQLGIYLPGGKVELWSINIQITESVWYTGFLCHFIMFIKLGLCFWFRVLVCLRKYSLIPYGIVTIGKYTQTACVISVCCDILVKSFYEN